MTAETEEGKTSPARRVKGLTFAEAALSLDDADVDSPQYPVQNPVPPTPSAVPQPQPAPMIVPMPVDTSVYPSTDIHPISDKLLGMKPEMFFAIPILFRFPFYLFS